MLEHCLIWGAKSKSLILLNMIKKKEIFYQKKKIKNIKPILIDPAIKKIDFFSDAKFINTKKDFEKYLSNSKYFIVAIGGDFNSARVKISNILMSKKLKPLSCISSQAYICKTVKYGVGIQIMPNATIHNHVKIGNFVIVNTSSTIDHETEIGDGVHIMGGAAIAGKVKIQNNVSIGTNATILPNVVIGEGSFIGAGAVVTKNVKKNAIVVGNPAKFLKRATHKVNYYFLKK